MYTWEMKTFNIDQNNFDNHIGYNAQEINPTKNFLNDDGCYNKNKIREPSSRIISIHSLVKKLMALEWARIKGTKPYMNMDFLKREAYWGKIRK